MMVQRTSILTDKHLTVGVCLQQMSSIIYDRALSSNPHFERAGLGGLGRFLHENSSSDVGGRR